MKILLPVENDSMQTQICQSFGRAPYFLVYDTDKNMNIFVANTAADSAGGAGIKAAQIAIDSGAKVAIVPRLGQNAADVLVSADIAILTAVGDSVVENINLYKSNKLTPLKNIHSGFHKGN